MWFWGLSAKRNQKQLPGLHGPQWGHSRSSAQPAVPDSKLPALPFHPQAHTKVQKTKLTLSKPGAATANPKTVGIPTAANSKEAQTNRRIATEQLGLEARATRKTRHTRIISSCRSESWQLFASSSLSLMSWDGRLGGQHLHSTFSLTDSRWN